MSFSSSPLFNTFPSPVPPLPEGTSRVPVLGPINTADVFSTPQRGYGDDKPLPPIGQHERPSEADTLQHHSTASASEPPLVLDRDSGCILLGLSAISQQDLTTNDILPARFSLGSSPRRQQEETANLAAPCWAEDEEFLPKDEIAEWLGGQHSGVVTANELCHQTNKGKLTDAKVGAEKRSNQR
ncbi:hypothetical protein BD311DRAFT_811187 [Dichomitus squalens]|uniref:Uncharacterized protein n=1 Tax=Dichomitus squalens TaxID=114155 RepID=A0A4Q9M9G2_9APHY|nr:hypothetical protein BD311DRAFT_811187 [Dichomitus squalens]